jgi:hypothetical protein
VAQGIVYVVDGDELRRMMPSAPESEDRMQQLVAQYPELITDGDGDLLLVAREPSIGDGETTGRWALDHLFVTREAVPVLVELKRASDTRIRREVVGQLIDYAANASAHWGPGTIAASFARTVGQDAADASLAAFIGDHDPQDFWEQVDANLVAGRIKLVFVADIIPRELATVVEFLNEQMKADVRAIELRWFSGDGNLTTLTPRVIGETARAVATKQRASGKQLDVESWIAERIAPHQPSAVPSIKTACAVAAELGGNVFIPSSAGSIVGSWPTDEGKTTYPFGVYPSGKIVLRLGYLKNRPQFRSEAARQAIYDELSSLVGPLHTKSLSGEPGFPSRVLEEPAKLSAYRDFLDKVVSRAVKSSEA